MTTPDLYAEAKRLISERCLIAADIDKTLVGQLKEQDDERKYFIEDIAPN